MKNQINDTYQTPSGNTKATSQWYYTAITTAVIGGVFSLIALELMCFNYFQRTVAEPKRADELEELKIQLRQPLNDQQLLSQIQELDLESISDPNIATQLKLLKAEFPANPQDQQLLSKMHNVYMQLRQNNIRELDLQIRQIRMRRWDFSQRGSYLLLGGVVVFLIGVKSASAYKKKLPAPQPAPDRLNEQLRRAIYARWSVTVGLLILATAALFLAIRPRIDFATADTQAASFPTMEEIRQNWPRFRGPGGLGTYADTNVPTKWNGTTEEAILWKTKVPLPGHNSPIVWEDRVFVTGADSNTCEVFCFDALSGNLLWNRRVKSTSQDTEPIEVMEDTGFAASTAVTDGRRVYAIFATGDVGCFNLDGREIWARKLSVPDSAYGYASSLAMYRKLLLIQYDQGGAEDEISKLIALDTFTGRTVWETKRPVPNSWSSPIVIEAEDQPQIITSGDPWVIAYNPTNGTEIWRAKCLGGEIAPSPIYTADLIIAIEPYTTMVAIRPDGQGDVTKTHVVWKSDESTPDISCPVSNGEFIFLLTTEGFLTSYKTADGKMLWEQDLQKNFLASPSLVGNRLYMLSEKGIMYIAEAGAEYKELARCQLGEECYASPAFMDGRIYIRAKHNLYCIGTTD
ncbi:MAG: outer membrane protein assembly factor BamB family protein [Planctomycetota bacterium]|jgi:outer membrane protein assembly factor BamB